MYESLLVKLANALQKADIPYMVIGGQAVLRYGEPRLTQDIDITLGVDIDKLTTILALTHQNGLHVEVGDPEAFVKKTNVLPVSDGATGIRIDLIFSFSPYEREAIRRAQPHPVNGHHVYYASVEDIIIHKVVAGRPRDLDDVRGIIARNPVYDSVYVREWLTSFGNIFSTDLLARLKGISS